MFGLWRYLVFPLISFKYFSEAFPNLNLQPNLGLYDKESDCTCIPFYLCKNGRYIVNGADIIDIRIKNGPCEHYMDVCCENPEPTSKPPTTTSPSATVKAGCGYRQSNGSGFTITGDVEDKSQFGEFPWMVALLHNNQYQCGGSLIHPQVVVTAAHCVSKQYNNFKIRAGEWDSQHTNEPYPHQDRDVKSITIHPQYQADDFFNDIAILVLESPVEITDHINVICLPPQHAFVDAGKCFSTGWSKNLFGNNERYQAILKKRGFFQIPKDDCVEELRLSRKDDYYELHESFTCASADARMDSCEDNGGSPLVCPINREGDRYYQAGVVTWDLGCGEEGAPKVYTNVANFRSWIDEQMYFNGFEFPSYVL